MVFDISEYKLKMNKSFDILKKEFSGLRTGRVSTGLIEPLTVDAYGSRVPISQVGNISVPDSRTLSIQVWDQSLVPAVESAIRSSNLGINPMTEGTLIRLPVPDLTEERRKEIVKLASKYTEECKIGIRNIRRDAMDQVKILERNKEISKDIMFDYSENIQKLTDDFITNVDNLFVDKEKDILTI